MTSTTSRINKYIIKEIEETPKTPSYKAELFRTIAVKLIETGNDLLAVEFWKEICSNISDEYLAYVACGCLSGSLYFQGNYEEACKTLERAKKFNPDDPNVYDQLGLNYALIGKFDKAVENIEKGLKMDPTSASLASSHYEIYALMNDYTKALEVLKKDLKVGNISTENFCKEHAEFVKSKFCQEWERKILKRMLEDLCQK